MVGGEFTVAGSAAANRIARWDGSSWRLLDRGMERITPVYVAVHALTVYHDQLIAGGSF